MRRVRDRCVRAAEHVIDHDEVDDWTVALGLVRYLYFRRNVRTIDHFVHWINYAQTMLAAALNPKLLGTMDTDTGSPPRSGRR